MSAERLAPDAILASSNLSGAVTDIDDDPDSADANWLTAPGNNNNTEVRVSFPTPSGSLSTGAGLQEFRVQVRKTNHSTDPTCTVELYESGSLVSTLVSSQTVSSTSGTVLSGTWDAAGRAAANIECRVTGTTGGGSPGNRASLEVGAIEWNAEVAAAGFTLTAAQGSLSLAGQGATFTRSLKLTAGQGSYALSGQPANLNRLLTMAAGQGAFALIGQDAALAQGVTLIAEGGSYNLTGIDSALRAARTLTAAQGGISLTGQGANLARGYTLTAGQGGVSLSGQLGSLLAARALVASQGAITLTGRSASLTTTGGGNNGNGGSNKLSNQGNKQNSIRAVSMTAYDYNGDWHAMWDVQAISGTDYNERLLKYINTKLGANYSDLPGAQQAFAESTGFDNWSSMGTFTATIP